jgi:2-hydroxycyclohexanecarboxyl-CoA dehydrogenase
MTNEQTVAVVTGGAGGIGGGIVRRLARAGYVVGIVDRDLAGAEATCAAVRALGVESAAAEADITDDAQVRRAFGQLRERLGPPAVLVNNAGWDAFMTFRESTPELWERVIAINFRGTLSCTHAALADVCAAGERGRVISIASDAGRVGSFGEAVYSGCKAAIIGFSKALAREVAKIGQRVVFLFPGTVTKRAIGRFRWVAGSTSLSMRWVAARTKFQSSPKGTATGGIPPLSADQRDAPRPS